MWKDMLKSALRTFVNSITREGTKNAPHWYEKLKAWWSGKCIAIIGPTASGKNSFFNKLKREIPPAEHIQTRGAEEVNTFKFEWPLPNKETVEFRCKNSINVGGEIDERDRFWLQACSDADVIFYLVDLERLSEKPEETKDRIADDLKWIVSNMSDLKGHSVIHILLNKVDILLDGYEAPTEIEDKIVNGVEGTLGEIESRAKKILGVYDTRISGINPVSMVDPYVFNNYFGAILGNVFESELK